jgi:hypothetical protein
VHIKGASQVRAAADASAEAAARHSPSAVQRADDNPRTKRAGASTHARQQFHDNSQA